MKWQSPRNFDHVLHPFMFVLKEGKNIKSNYLDYSLLLLQVGLTDIIPSPSSKTSNQTFQLLKK